MIVGEVAELTGLPAKTLRYYEEIGLVTPARRGNGYRDYSKADINKLHFLQRARSLGFSIADCRALLSLYGDKARESKDVKAIARQHLHTIDQKNYRIAWVTRNLVTSGGGLPRR